MSRPIPSHSTATVHGLLRIVAGLAFFSHGAAKIFGWFGGMGPDGGTVDLMTRYGVAGVIEVVAGACLVVGLGTRLAAFIASGEMAAAYFIGHALPSGSIWWWQNHGELVMLYCFIWLVFAAWGSGAWSLDNLRARAAMGETAPDRS